MGFIIACIIIAFVYFIPSIIGWNKRNSAPILAVNIFLGWTFIGWVVALIWAFSNDDTEPAVANQAYDHNNKRIDTEIKIKSTTINKPY